MNTIALVRTVVDRLAPVMLALFSSASIAFGLVWSLHAVMRPFV